MSVLSRYFEPAQHRPGMLFSLADLGSGNRQQNEAQIRSLCATAYVGNDRALARILGRFKLFVDTSDVGLSSHLMLDGYWEMWTTELIAALVRPGMVCADVGANLGYFSMLMAELAGSSGRIHAFEPNPRLAACLRDSAAVNGFCDRITVHEAALGCEQGGEVCLIVPPGEPKNGYIVAGAHVAGGIPMRISRMDSYPELARLDLVKIDADTSEEAIWTGMDGILARHASIVIVIEFAAARYADPRAFLERMKAAGFVLQRLDPRIGVVPTDADTLLSRFGGEDQMLVLAR